MGDGEGEKYVIFFLSLPFPTRFHSSLNPLRFANLSWRPHEWIQRSRAKRKKRKNIKKAR